MVSIHIDNVGDMAVVECEGRLVRSDAAFKLRDAVTSQAGASMVVLDLTEVNAMGGGGIGMLVFLLAAMGSRPRYSIQAVQSL